jgi:hypothetical protein
VLLAVVGGSPAKATVIGATTPESFSVCEAATDVSGAPRPECQASDIRFQGDSASSADSDFGFAVASGRLNGDDLDDLVVADPKRNKVYIFFGRVSTKTAYGLDPAVLSDRTVAPDTKADVILERNQPFPGQVGSFGFSIKVGHAIAATNCPPNNTASSLVIGAPGNPGTVGNAPGTIFHLPAGALCGAVANPPAPVHFDPETIGQALQSPDAENDDEFGYAVALGHLLLDSATDDDVLVGARGAKQGAGRVSVFPVTAGVVSRAAGKVVRFEGKAGDHLGEVLAVGDLDLDFDAIVRPKGNLDDLAMGAVGARNGKVVLAQGPLSPTGGRDGDGIYREGVDTQLKSILGEKPGDYFGFSVDIGKKGKLAVGAVFADNEPPAAGGTAGGDPRTNVSSGPRVNGGKAYIWNADVFDALTAETSAAAANVALVARRSGDQLGFGVAFGDLDHTQKDSLIVTARREDGSGLKVNEIDRGTAYVVYDSTPLTSPVDLNRCALNANCTGVGGVDVMVFGGDRSGNVGDELGYAVATGDWNGDQFADLFLTSITHNRVYAVTLDDHDNDLGTNGRNIRDDDDDNDLDTDKTDCAPLDAAISAAAAEILCNAKDENCNGIVDDAPDHDADGYDACAPTEAGDKDTKAKDCDDNDAASFPGAVEVCDGNSNACSGTVPTNERDLDGDHYVRCTAWVDAQHDNPTILGGDDCADSDPATFPGAAQTDSAVLCMKDLDDDGYGDTTPPAGVTPGSDCDDKTAAGAFTFPGAAQNESPVLCMKDVDNDGFGDATSVSPIVHGTDCSDTDAATHPGAAELCDGDDNACAGSIPAIEKDTDGDHYVKCSPWADPQGNNGGILGGGDCDETDVDTFPGSSPKEVFAAGCMRDKDHDDFGEVHPPAGVTAGTDCDDASATAAVTFPGAAQIDGPLNCMKDGDDDGYGDASVALPVVRGTDCDDTKIGIHPGGGTGHPPAAEIPDDGIDQDCSGHDQVTCYADADHDGYGVNPPILNDTGVCLAASQSKFNTDCKDDDPDIHPGAAETPDDHLDQDCSGSDTVTCFLDSDRDGFGTVLGTTVLAGDGVCNPAQQEAPAAGDCDDADANTHPGAVERCDGNDNTCSGSVPANERDVDGDHYVPCAGWSDTQGNNPTILGGGDCDAADPKTFPGAAPHESIPSACMRDKDGDGFGDFRPPVGVTAGTDCDDTSASAAVTFPGAAQIEGPLNCMKDADDDGYGDASGALPVVRGTDCNDQDPQTHPGAIERCDGISTSCGGTIPANETDADGDGYVVCAPFTASPGGNPAIVGGGDCAPTDPQTFPGAAPLEAVPTACMRDKDGDDYGDQSPPLGVTAGTDCDDASATASVTFPGAAQIDGPLNCMKDADDDGYGDALAALPVVRGTDCADSDLSRHPGAVEIPNDGIDQNCDGNDSASCFVDGDLDGFGGTTPLVPADGDCIDPGESPVSTDCDDADPARHPGAQELPGDGIDQDCNGVDAAACVLDADRDGFGTVLGTPKLALDGTCDTAQQEAVSANDCDDADPLVHPGATEIVGDGIDQDCSGADSVVCFVDTDLDGFGSAVVIVATDGDCTDPGESAQGTDCNDGDLTVHPGAAEIPLDGIDQDCNGSDLTTCYVDGDLDGFGGSVTVAPGVGGCAVAGKSPFNTDCNDANIGIFPGAAEITGDGIDQDCNGADRISCIVDADRDGFGTSVGTVVLAPDGHCDTVQGEALVGGDCNDASALVYPGATEVAGDGLDQDCNGFDSVTCYVDGDHDLYGSATTLIAADGDCTDLGESTVGTDCDDTDPSRHPGAVEVPGDGIDQDCSGSDTVNCTLDADQDGYGTIAGTVVLATDGHCDTAQSESATATDCNDADVAIHPGATDIPNDGIDQNCDGSDVATCFLDADVDGYGGPTPVVLNGAPCSGPGKSPLNTDCNDASNAVYPGAPEVADDGIDQNCSGADTITCHVDADRDGFGTSAGTTSLAGDGSCDTAQQESVNDDDCDDANAAIHPGAAEIPNDGIDQDCSGADLLTCYIDGDHDGFGSVTTAPPVAGSCTSPGLSSFNTDCNDLVPSIHPGATDVPGDGIDQDCNGSDTVACIADLDRDGYGTSAGTVVLAADGHCDLAQQEASAGGDCDDTDATSHPGATERCDGNDNKCLGSIPAGERDLDGDGYVACGAFVDTQGDNPSVLGGGDCDATDADTYPGAAHSESFSTACMRDKDHDGFGDLTPPPGVLAGTDCDDRSAAAAVTFPGAAQIEAPLNCMRDADNDGYGDASAVLPVVPGGDCADSDAARHPSAAEVCGDGIDSNCDGADPSCSAFSSKTPGRTGSQPSVRATTPPRRNR